MKNAVFEKSETYANVFMGPHSVSEDITNNQSIGTDDAISIMKSLVLVDMYFKDYMGELYLQDHDLLPPLARLRLYQSSIYKMEVNSCNVMNTISRDIPINLVFDFYDNPCYSIRKNKEYIMKLVRFITSWVDNEVENGDTIRVETFRRGEHDYEFDYKVSCAIEEGKEIHHLSENYLVTSENIDKSELIYWRDRLIKVYKVER